MNKDKIYRTTILDKYLKYITMFKNKSMSNIENILPDHFLEEWRKDLLLSEEKIKAIDFGFDYLDKFEKNQQIFEKIENAKVNGIAYRVFKELEKNETISSNLHKFRPNKGYAKLIKYNQASTVTGRLTTATDSPNILTLPSRCRKIFESRWQESGELIYVDFKTLEPRVIRKINNKDAAEDIYLEISNSLDFEVDRVIIKRGIISTLYGATSQISGLSKERSNTVLEATRQYFDMSSIAKKAYYTYDDVGCRRNFFGRPIWNIEETKENKIVNNYIQSTAVDIALSYFSELCDKIDLELCKPIFIIHDALVLDVHESYIDVCKSIIKTGYTCPKLGHFSIDIDNLSETF